MNIIVNTAGISDTLRPLLHHWCLLLHHWCLLLHHCVSVATVLHHCVFVATVLHHCLCYHCHYCTTVTVTRVPLLLLPVYRCYCYPCTTVTVTRTLVPGTPIPCTPPHPHPLPQYPPHLYPHRMSWPASLVLHTVTHRAGSIMAILLKSVTNRARVINNYCNIGQRWHARAHCLLLNYL